jgi:uncharacterized ferritin-like protein (DUF455 family)
MVSGCFTTVLLIAAWRLKRLSCVSECGQRLERSGDEKSATTLQHNYREEIHHVKMGRKWFEHVHRCRGLDKPPTEVFQVRSHAF